MGQYILNFGTGWRYAVSFISWLLYHQDEGLQYPVDRRMDGLHSQTGRWKKVIRYVTNCGRGVIMQGWNSCWPGECGRICICSLRIL